MIVDCRLMKSLLPRRARARRVALSVYKLAEYLIQNSTLDVGRSSFSNPQSQFYHALYSLATRSRVQDPYPLSPKFQRQACQDVSA